MTDAGPEATPRRRASRLARVQATRTQVLNAATDLFLSQGYVATTMGDIAAAAGVAVQTLYLRFGSKAQLLKECFDVAVVGDDQPIPLAERTWVEQLKQEPRLNESLKLLVRNSQAILERAVPLYTSIEQAAADPEVAELLIEVKRQKLEMVGVFASMLLSKTGYNRRVSLPEATDLLYAIGSEELYRLLCIERGWSGDRWKQFVLGSLSDLLS
ncbi:MAG TPA: helix-turn-helix domain-containing protein [Acidimicrobiales bacterium]|nr:helix-turn-helix domain-containing protein [Acidimicrobiales bacterium]